ncbi:MAG: Protein-export protein SecB [Pseudomonadota bacterium]|jgi:preprotein translocase subunit SecB
MTDEINNAESNADEANAPQFAVQRIYVKDVSFETPMGVEAFRQQWQPKVGQELGTAANKVDEDLYEVVLKITINVQLGDKTAFLVEVQQAGLFMAANIEGPQLAHLLNTACPTILFPYAREAIDNLCLKGSFPALALPPINFDMLFARAIAQAQAEAEGAGQDA